MRGGRRAGSGRKPGSLSRKTRAVAEGALKRGVSPLEYLLAVMRDPEAPLTARLDAAKAALPCCHPRLSAVEHRGDPLATVVIQMMPGDGNL